MLETVFSLERLTESIFASRQGFHADPDLDLTTYVKAWNESDYLDGRAAPAKTVVLRTRGCTWDYRHGCTMCGYFNETAHQKVTADQIVAQYRRLEGELRDETVLKIYTGGNFLDPHEVFPAAQETIVAEASKRVRKITMESRPEYCEPERLRRLAELAAATGTHLEVAIGLESSDPVVCHQAINKGYGFEEFRDAAIRCRDAGIGVKTYLLLKPPFLTEDEAVEDAVRSIEDAAPFSDIVSVNPTNIQKFTLVEKLYEHREYRSPWLWSVLEVLRRGRPLAGSAILKSDPVGGGSPRGAHNCGRCDERLLHRIDQYNTTQDAAFLDEADRIDCRCRPEYAAVRRLEGYLAGAFYL